MSEKNFMWGVSSAAYQVEGAVHEDGRTDSIWDVHCRKEGAIFNGDTGETACDFYHRYKEDISIMSSIGVNAYRMSLSWNRILPQGTGETNPKGIDFYNRVIDELLKNGITPVITLLHWDLPEILYRKGGYLNRDFADWFYEYSSVVAKSFSDRVGYFITINEPQLILGAHRGSGKAPGVNLTDIQTVPLSHNLLLGHGRAVKALRQNSRGKIKIGISNQGCIFYPQNDTQKNTEAAKNATFDYKFDNWYSSLSWYSDPVYLGKYPDTMFNKLSKYLPDTLQDDLKEINAPLDFCGQNFYNAFPVNENGERVNERCGTMYNSEGWSITPTATYHLIKWLYERYRKPIIITENGMACHDWVSLDGKVHDPQRSDFIARYVYELKRAQKDGAEVDGYFYWAYSDNMEWNCGYRPRFGLVHVDYQTQKRTIKDSAYDYKKIILSNGNKLL